MAEAWDEINVSIDRYVHAWGNAVLENLGEQPLFPQKFEAEWDEQKHPRDKDGEFAHGGDGEKLTAPERDALFAYTADTTMNEYLREGTDVPDSVREAADRLDGLMRPTTESQLLYRLVPEQYISALKPETSFTDKAFTSTSKDATFPTRSKDEIGPPREGGRWATMVITVPPGVRAVDVNQHLQHDPEFFFRDQKELILARNTRFVVDDVRGLKIYVRAMRPK